MNTPDKPIYVKANEDLFEKWRSLGVKISNLSAIAQNDMEVTEEQVIEWAEYVKELLNTLLILRNETLKQFYRVRGEQ